MKSFQNVEISWKKINFYITQRTQYIVSIVYDAQKSWCEHLYIIIVGRTVFLGMFAVCGFHGKQTQNLSYLIMNLTVRW
jgi:hypothetical protein